MRDKQKEIAKKATEAISAIKHPENSKGIVDLGILTDVEVKKNYIGITLSFSRPNDPFRNSIKNACIQAIKKELGDGYNVDVTINTAEITKEPEKPDLLKGVKNIVVVSSGKGGVGKSTVAVNLAVALAGSGSKVGLLDADISGPSIPKMFGLENAKPEVSEIDGMPCMQPLEKYGVKMLSIGFYIPPDSATIWRGPMASSALKQLLFEGNWGELDYLLVDLPPGTSDIHLSMVQEVSVTGAIIVSTPQEIALADAIKGISMFRNKDINVPILGLIENMAWFTPEELPDNKYFIFGKEGCKKLAIDLGIPLIGQIPIVQGIREGADTGNPVSLDMKSISGEAFRNLAEKVADIIQYRNKELSPTKKVEVKN